MDSTNIHKWRNIKNKKRFEKKVISNKVITTAVTKKYNNNKKNYYNKIKKLF